MELARFPSRGGFSLRSIFTFVLAVIATVILGTIFLSATPVHAAPEANWSGDSIVYDTHGYTEAEDFKDATATIPAGSTVYKSPVQTDGNSQKIFILYFSPGVDPPTASSVNYVEFDYKNDTTSNPANAKSVNLTLKGEEDPASSCSVEGVGWIICPLSVFLAGSMDWLFNTLATFIEVKPPVLGDANNSMFIAWNITRGIANLAFVIVFLIIIYAQLTNFQVSNYGIKRLLPRLIVAAVLVNISFYIAALAIDISNILAYSIQDIFTGIRESVFSMTNDNYNGAEWATDTTWASVTSVILAGGGIIGGLHYASSGGLYLLLPLLVGLGLTALFVAIILAARQAIILLLVIIAPLAFVANLLPNTEKWFGKWKDLFLTMLIFFPAFSLVFGGSQLAGQIIIQNAGDNIVMLLFGLAVQVAPLVITPLLLKLSGGLLGKIAQIANDPRKGLIDRNKDWAKRRAEHVKQQNIARGARWYNPASYGSGLVRSTDFRKRRLADNTEVWKQRATNRYNSTSEYGKIHERQADADLNKEHIHNEHAAHIEHLKRTPGSAIHTSAMNVQLSKERLEAEQQNVTAYYNRQRSIGTTALSQSMQSLAYSKVVAERRQGEADAYLNTLKNTKGTALHLQTVTAESAKNKAKISETALSETIGQYKTGKIDRSTLTAQESTLMDDMAYDTQQLFALNRAVQTTEQYQRDLFAQTLAEPDSQRAEELLTIAGSVDPNGKQRALADALAQKSRARKETVDNIKAIINFKNLTTEDIRKLGEGVPVPGIDISQDVMAAAIQMTLGGKDTKQIIEAIKNIDFSFPTLSVEDREELQVIAADALAENSARPPFVTAGFIAMMKSGLAYNKQPFTGKYDREGLSGMIIEAINNQKLDSKKFQTAGRDYSQAIFEALELYPDTVDTKAKRRLLAELATTLDPEREASEGLGDSLPVLQQIQDNAVIRSLNNQEVDAQHIRQGGEYYAQSILWTLQRNPDTLDAAARNKLEAEVSSMLQQGSIALGKLSPILESIREELRR